MKPASNIQKTVLRSFAAYALNEANARTFHMEPPSIEEVERRLGPEAAAALGDIRAAEKSYWKAVDRFLLERESR